MGKSKSIKRIKSAVKIALFAISPLLLILLILSVLTFFPPAQNILKNKAVNIAKEQLKTDISLESLRFIFPRTFLLNALYVEGTNGDTLFYSGSLKINIDLLPLIKGNINIGNVRMSDARIGIVRPSGEKGKFNFEFPVKRSKEDDEPKGSTPVSIGSVQLKNIRFLYSDSMAGNVLDVFIGNFGLKLNQTDITAGQYGINSLVLENFRGHFSSFSQPGTDEPGDGKPLPLQISLKNSIRLKHIDFVYQDQYSGQKIDIANATMSLEEAFFDLQAQQIKGGKLQIDNSGLAIIQQKQNRSAISPVQTKEDDGEGFSWHVTMNNLLLNNNVVVMEDGNHEPLESGFDSHYIHLKEIHVDANNIALSPGGGAVDLKEMHLKDKSGLAIQGLSGSLDMGPEALLIKRLDLKTEKSFLAIDAKLAYPSLKKLFAADSSVKVELFDAGVGLNIPEAAIFLPLLADSFPELIEQNASLLVNTSLNGTTGLLGIEHLDATLGDAFKASLSGSVQNPGNKIHRQFDIRIDNLDLMPASLMSRYFPALLPKTLSLPESLRMKGNVDGNSSRFKLDLMAGGPQGNLRTNLTFASDSILKQQSIKGGFSIPRYNLGELLSTPETLGHTTAGGTFNLVFGESGLSALSSAISIDSLGVKGYVYQNLTLDATLDEGIGNLHLVVDDPNLVLTADAMAGFNSGNRFVNADIILQGANPYATFLTQNNVQFSADAVAAFRGESLDELNGYFTLKNIVAYRNGKRYLADSLHVSALQTDDLSSLKLSSPFLNADYSGNVKPSEIGAIINNHLNHFASLREVKDTLPGNRTFTLNAFLRNDDVLNKVIVPGLDIPTVAKLTATYSSDAGSLDLTMGAPDIQYGGAALERVSFQLSSNQENLSFDAGFERLDFNAIALLNTRFKGLAQNDSVLAVLSFFDKNNVQFYHFEPVLRFTDTATHLHIKPDGLTLNSNSWQIDDRNNTTFMGKSVHFKNLNLTNNKAGLLVETRLSEQGDETHIHFNQFNLLTLAAILGDPDLVPSAMIDGRIKVNNQQPGVGLAADLEVVNLRYMNQLLFEHISLEATSLETTGFNLDMKFAGGVDTSRIYGVYKLAEKRNTIDFKVDLKQIDIAPYQTLLKSSFNELKGFMNGGLTIKGDLSQPVFNGSIAFVDATINPVLLNSPLYFKDEQIDITDNRFSFNAFNFTDKNKNSARVNGDVVLSYSDPHVLNLNIKANDFLFLDTKSTGNDLYYGTVLADINATLSGNTQNPVIDLDANIKEGSQFTYLVPQSEVSENSYDDMVMFTNKDTLNRTLREMADTLFRGDDGRMIPDFRANIGFEKDIPITVIVDPIADEQLNIKGKGDLRFTMSQKEPVSLAGIYTIKEGSYSLTLFDLIKRKFTIEDGSYLMWSGDVMKPNTDIRAKYTVEASPLGLVASEIGSENEQLKKYREMVPFYVKMNLSGQLLSPVVDFDIEAEQGRVDDLVSSKLSELNSNESELNKQVLSLLVFKNFMGSGTGATDMGYTINRTARTGISNLLSSGFNRFAQNYIKGVNLTFDLESQAEGSDGTGKTDLKIAASKSLFNNRLTLEVGSSINIENGTGGEQSPQSLAGDFLVDYKITEDGFLSAQAFRSSEYEDVLVGNVTKTGISLKLNKRFNSFKELFKRKNKPKKQDVPDNAK